MADDPKLRAAETGRDGGVEIDAATGLSTTGHSWDGIRELNRPLPRWWLITLYGTIVWALIYIVFYPAIPLLKGATSGVLGYSTRAAVEEEIAAARAIQSRRLDEVARRPLSEIAADPELKQFAAVGGKSAFLVNCVPCHGSGATGSQGYANLNDDEWLWGGSLEAIRRTIAFGVRSDHPDTRTSEMPAFGADGLLTRQQISAVTEHVLSLAGMPHNAALAASGKPVFADNCAVCHGEGGDGKRDLGAPALNDVIWLYDDDRASIAAQVTRPRHGVMPAWTGRLDEAVISALAVFVHSLGGGEAE
jgi:cytochrome c oxidase cbb3-type subunit 3